MEMFAWNDLPNEMKEMVVQRSTQATRNALKCCSRSSQQLVETSRLNAIYHLEIQFSYRTSQKWRITMQARPESQMECKAFESFEKFNSRLLEIVESARCIQKLEIFSLPDESKTPFKLRSSEQQPPVLVERVFFYESGTVEQKNVLSQMEPGFLRSVRLSSDGGNSEIYDIPQIIRAEKVSVNGASSIRERQLLNLNASNVGFGNINCSVRKFIYKCAREAGTKPRRFFFRGLTYQNMGLKKLAPEKPFQTVILKTARPYLKMELKFGGSSELNAYVGGSIQNASQRYSTNLWQFGCPSSFRVIEELEIIVYATGSVRIIISRRTYSTVHFVFKNHEKFQQKVDEIMDNVDFIKSFNIHMETAKEKMMWKPRRENNLLMVKYLDVVGNNSITSIQELLELIDPNFAMRVNIRGNSELEHSSLLFNMPQIRNAAVVKIKNPYLQDEQLLGMKAKTLWCQSSFMEGRDDTSGFPVKTLLTEAGINQYIKTPEHMRILQKHLRNLDNENMSFALGIMPPDGINEATFEGLEIMQTTVKDEETEWMIDTTHRKFVLVVRLDRRGQFSGGLERRP